MKYLTAFEHGWLEIGENRDLTTTEAEALATAESALPAGCLQWGYRRMKFAQFCGVVQVDGLQLEVLPKVYPHQTEAQQRTTLLNMLTHAGDLEALEGRQAGLASSRTTLLDLFIQHFAQLLERQLQQGLLRDYRDIDDTLGQVRGRIDLIRQQRENLFKPQRLACSFNELMADVPINRLLHTALHLVTTLTDDPYLRRQLRGLCMRFADIGTLAPHECGPGSADLNRMQHRYARVVELAHLFLDGQYLDVRTGRQQAFSLLFDMNRLFERYTASRLRPLTRRHGLRLMEQGPRRYLAEDSQGKGRLLMRPDISLLNDSESTVAILDTKWKLLNGATPLASVAASDLYQLSAYANIYGCLQVGLLYPEQPGLGKETVHTLRLSGPSRATLSVQGIPLSDSNYAIPLAGIRLA